MITVAQLEAAFAPAIESVYKYEGGFQKQSADTGNYINGKLVGTNLGITPNAYKTYYKVEPTEQVMRNLTKAKTSPIYKKNYWDKIRGDEISNDSVATLMLDVVVNSGTGMIKSFKQLMNDTAGKKLVSLTSTPFTKEEIKILNALPQDIYFKNLKVWRERFYKALVDKKPTNSVYLKGWLNRLNKHQYSGAMSKKNYAKPLLIGLGIVVVGGIVYYNRDKLRKLVA